MAIYSQSSKYSFQFLLLLTYGRYIQQCISYVVVKVISFSFITGTMIWKLCVTYFGHLDGWDYFRFACMLGKQIRTNNIAWSFKTEELKGKKVTRCMMRLSKRCWRKLESSGTQHYVNLYIGTNVRKRLLFPSSGYPKKDRLLLIWNPAV